MSYYGHVRIAMNLTHQPSKPSKFMATFLEIGKIIINYALFVTTKTKLLNITLYTVQGYRF